MRRVMAVAVVGMFLLGFAGFVLVAEAKGTPPKKAEGPAGVVTIKGKITSIDSAKSEIVVRVREKKGSVNRTIAVSPGLIASLKIGQTVKITHKPGSNVAESLTVVRKAATTATKRKGGK